MATLVFLPFRFVLSPYDPDEIERIVGRDLAWKHRLLLVVSLSWLVAAAWVYLEVYVPR